MAKTESFFGGTCGECGFEYREYDGHIIPCPRCRLKTAIETLQEINAIAACYRDYPTPEGLRGELSSIADLTHEVLTKLDL